ncbi:PqqD family peptide modification chaperone [Chelativorans sp. ZYF759]|uniref:PqqD family peptide modification chaperone n=1 Tax=Chelativorans sp. ZYF759 TaxID=2692213 RepID=UPI00145FC989|nr:PqqD family peptide modification chaperone [Chelativorans sp. ZYF759]NMG39195.1 PqqD family peptide modification chaperone [Chelativorans sp. ZYF759]
MTQEDTRLYAFAPLEGAVRFVGGSEVLLQLLPRLCTGWSFEPVTEAQRLAPLEVALADGRFRLSAPWQDAPVDESDPFRAAANLAVDLLEAHLDEHPDLLAIHGACAVLGDTAVLFPGSSRAGKSTLSVALAAAGFPVLADDVLALSSEQPPHAISLGMHPRLRLPLPDAADAQLARFVADHSAAEDDKYAYLALPEGAGPSFGRTARLGAIVLLEREEGRDAELVSVIPGDGLQELMMQQLSPALSQADALPRLATVLDGIPCYRLSYGDLADAVAKLRAVFVEGEEIEAAPAPVEDEAAASPTPATQEGTQRTFAIGLRFVRADGATHHQIEDETFLTLGEAGAVFRLNPISSALWNLVENPMSVDLCTALLAEAFPDIDERRIMADVETHFAQMQEAGLVAIVQPVAPAETLPDAPEADGPGGARPVETAE